MTEPVIAALIIGFLVGLLVGFLATAPRGMRGGYTAEGPARGNVNTTPKTPRPNTRPRPQSPNGKTGEAIRGS